MLHTVAVLADIHGVLPALEAVLAEPDVIAADAIVLAGDLASGPQPVATLHRLRALGERAVWVHGNGERDLVLTARGETVTVPDPIISWAAGQLGAEEIGWLDGLPLTLVREVAGLGQVMFCHATPRDDEEVALVDSSMARWEQVLGGLPPQVGTVVCGHTHMPFLRLLDRRTVVNPGSIGMPYGTAGAHWALLGGSGAASISLRRTGYDADAACESIIGGCDYPEIEEWVDY
ncbi:MAG: metallophosphoesterase family protein, partial [Sciscionella sp.]